MEKWPILHQNHGLAPLKKSQFFHFQNSLFLQPKKAFFVLEYRKTHFPALYWLKTTDGEMVNFAPKPWVNPFAKIPIFRLFELLAFIAQRGVFSFQNIVKHCFLAYIALKKRWKNGNLNLLFLQPRKAFFRSRIS